MCYHEPMMPTGTRSTKPALRALAPRRTAVICAALVIVTLAVYWQVIGFDFVNYDDNIYVYQNSYLRDGLTADSVKWSFTTSRASTWQPMVWLSYMLDHQLGGLDPAQYHLTNVVFHALDSVLLFLLLCWLTGFTWRSAIVATVFAVHPLHVESVAWVTERKDVLSALFWLLGMAAYVWYARRPGWLRYSVVLLAYALGLMSKPMVITLPVVLFLLDYWPLRRFGSSSPVYQTTTLIKAALEKAPMLALAAGSIVVTLITQHVLTPEETTAPHSLGVRAANALVNYVWYTHKTFWPTGLGVFYPHPGSTLPFWMVASSAAFLAAITLLAILARRRLPYVTFGWLFFVVTLLPVIGLIGFGKHSVGDRFNYIPMIGLLILVVWGAADLLQRLRSTRLRGSVAAMSAGMAIACLAVAGHSQAGYWKNSITLFRQTLRVTENNAVAHYNLAVALKADGDDKGALAHLREALRIAPDDVGPNNTYGTELLQQGRVAEAMACFRRALRTRPADPEANSNMGVALAQQGDPKAAIAHFRRAIEASPDNPNARENLRAAEEMIGN